MNLFFKFSTQDTKGILLLLGILMGIHTYKRITHEYEKATPELSLEELEILKKWENEINLSSQKASTQTDKRNASNAGTKGILTIPEHQFNPNDLSKTDWENLGFTAKQANSIINYRNAITGFKIKKDVRKIYCISDEYYEKIEHLLMLPDSLIRIKTKKENHPTYLKRKEEITQIIELNSTDSAGLTKLKGIGPYWARRIIKQRDFLGGFYKSSQLLEIKGFPDSLFHYISAYISIDTTLITKININNFTIDDIKKHPQLWYGVGKSIVNYRSQHGPFKSIEDLNKLYSLKPQQIKDLAPYAIVK